MKMKPIITAFFFFLFAAVSRAEACPVCFQSGGEERWAFYATTVLLTMLPLMMVGGFVFFLKKRFEQMEAEKVEA
jgi:hypothetical protein